MFVSESQQEIMKANAGDARADAAGNISLCGYDLLISSGLCRTVQLRSEGYEFISDPEPILKEMRERRLPADLFTFLQRITEQTPRYSYQCEPYKAAILSIKDYATWWKSVINDKTRNMVRKATKKSVFLKIVTLDDSLLQGIKAIYDESPLRQGRPFKHFEKDIATLRREHATFTERSDFIGAFYNDRLIGFVKLVYQDGWASMMQIISALAHRDKAPTNALIAKAVEQCAERQIPLLQYGSWSRGSIGDFKIHHGFRCYDVPRYLVPLNGRGEVALRLGCHRPFSDRLSDSMFLRLIAIRSQVNDFKVKVRGSSSAGRAVQR